MLRDADNESAGKSSPASTTPSPEDAAGSAPNGEERFWYVLKVTSNREKSIRDALVRRIKRDGLEEFFGEIIIPTEKIVETRNGKRRTREQKLYPGYLMINMVLNDDTWYVVRDTTGVGDFTGSAGKPIPMREHEISKMLGREQVKEVEPAKVKIEIQTGAHVKIKEGSFEEFEGTVDSVDEASGKISVLVEIFGRATPVELEHWQVEKM